MRIVHIIDNLMVGGAQKLLVTFGREAGEYHIQTDIVCLDFEPEKSVVRELKDMGLSVTFFPSRKLLDLDRIRKIIQYLQKTHPDVIHTHLLYANVIGGIAGFAAGIPVVATLHSTGPDPWDTKGRFWFETQVLRFLDRRIIAVGQKTAEAHQHRFGEKIIDVIPNAVSFPVQLGETERISFRKELIGRDVQWLLISVGRFSPLKAFGDLIRAFTRLNSRYPQAVLVLVGDGEQREELETLARSIRMEHSIFFLGTRQDVPFLLAASDLFVSSSVVEGMPLVVMEALMAGLPVVATAVGDLPNILNENCGILVPPSQPELLASAAESLLGEENRMRTMGHQAKEYALENFTSSVWMGKLAQLYEEVSRSASGKSGAGL